MTTQITAIETDYAGHRFRSRLEARWAVFFDKLNIRWQYEPQGYEIGGGERYLPDFWLPVQSVWVEVKGAPTEQDMVLLYRASSADGLPISCEVGERPADVLDQRDLTAMVSPIPRVLLLGEVPRLRPSVPWCHWMTVLTAAGPALQRVFWWISMHWIDTVVGWRNLPDFNGMECPPVVFDGAVADAYAAARKARFEHGESGYLEPALRDAGSILPGHRAES